MVLTRIDKHNEIYLNNERVIIISSNIPICERENLLIKLENLEILGDAFFKELKDYVQSEFNLQAMIYEHFIFIRKRNE